MTERREARIRATIAHKQPDLQLFLDDVYSSQNYSAILRTADAVGILHLYYSVHHGNPFEVHRTISNGSERWLFSKRIDYTQRAAFLRQKQAEGFQVIVTHLSETTVTFRAPDYTRPSIIVVGNEVEGVSKEVATLADSHIKIPMYGMAQSLNVSVATAVTLYEAQRQRFEAGMYDTPQLDDAQQEALFEAWRHRDEIAKRSKGKVPIENDPKELGLLW